jgi:hypothetical protein
MCYRMDSSLYRTFKLPFILEIVILLIFCLKILFNLPTSWKHDERNNETRNCVFLLSYSVLTLHLSVRTFYRHGHLLTYGLNLHLISNRRFLILFICILCHLFHKKWRSVYSWWFLWFILWCHQHLDRIVSNNRMNDSWWIGEDLEGNSCGYMWQHVPEGAKGTMKSLGLNSQCPA